MAPKARKETSTNTQRSSGGISWPVLVLGIVLTAVASWLLMQRTQIQARYTTVAWQNASDESHMTKWLTEQGVPIVLHSTPFSGWKSSEWTPSSLARDLTITQVLSKKGQDNVFQYFASNQPLAEHEEFSVTKPYVEVIYPRERFFSLLEKPFEGYYYYSSGGVEILGLEQIYTTEQLKEVTFRATANQDLGQVNFWFGMENVTAYTHYDTSYNLHAISYGRKKFVLFPPEAYQHLKLYPCLHQFYRQTHTPVQDVLRADTIESLNGIEVTLHPGEVLFIPPYWFHCVVTMETTLSVNVWSQSEVFETMEEVYSSPLPFEESWGRETLLKVLSYYWEQISKELFAFEFSTLIKQVVLDRYEPLLELLALEKRQKFLSEAKSYCKRQHLKSTLRPQEITHIDKHVENIQQLFKTIEPILVREINFGNYVEHTALRILGTEDIVLLPFYLKQCFGL